MEHDSQRVWKEMRWSKCNGNALGCPRQRGSGIKWLPSYMESDDFAEFAKPSTYSRGREIIRRDFIVFWSPEVPRRNSSSSKVRGESVHDSRRGRRSAWVLLSNEINTQLLTQRAVLRSANCNSSCANCVREAEQHSRAVSLLSLLEDSFEPAVHPQRRAHLCHHPRAHCC